MSIHEQQQHGGVKKRVKEEDLKLYSQRLAVPRLESLPPCAWVHAQVRSLVLRHGLPFRDRLAFRLGAQFPSGCRVRTFPIITHDVGTEQNRACGAPGREERALAWAAEPVQQKQQQQQPDGSIHMGQRLKTDNVGATAEIPQISGTIRKHRMRDGAARREAI
jgi:hypothetical protein